MRMMSRTSTEWMESLRRSKRAQRVRKALVKDVPAAEVVAIAIAIAADAVEAARVVAQAAVREVTVVATPAVVAADVEEGRTA